MNFIVVTIPFNRINMNPVELNEGIGSDVPNVTLQQAPGHSNHLP